MKLTGKTRTGLDFTGSLESQSPDLVLFTLVGLIRDKSHWLGSARRPQGSSRCRRDDVIEVTDR